MPIGRPLQIFFKKALEVARARTEHQHRQTKDPDRSLMQHPAHPFRHRRVIWHGLPSNRVVPAPAGSSRLPPTPAGLHAVMSFSVTFGPNVSANTDVTAPIKTLDLGRLMWTLHRKPWYMPTVSSHGSCRPVGNAESRNTRITGKQSVIAAYLKGPKRNLAWKWLK